MLSAAAAPFAIIDTHHTRVIEVDSLEIRGQRLGNQAVRLLIPSSMVVDQVSQLRNHCRLFDLRHF